MRINRTGLESALFGKSAGDVIKQFAGDDVIKHMNGDDVTKQSNGNFDACAEDDDDFWNLRYLYYIFFSSALKKNRTSCKPSWTEYKQKNQFDNHLILVWN